MHSPCRFTFEKEESSSTVYLLSHSNNRGCEKVEMALEACHRAKTALEKAMVKNVENVESKKGRERLFTRGERG